MTQTAAPAGELELLALDFEAEQECDGLDECHEAVTYRVTCRIGGCWGLLCTKHMRSCAQKQRAADAFRGGQHCAGCDATGTELLEFEPILSTDDHLLW